MRGLLGLSGLSYGYHGAITEGLLRVIRVTMHINIYIYIYIKKKKKRFTKIS